MKRLAIALSTVALTCAASSAFAGKDSGIYIGASVASSNLDYSEVDVEDTQNGYKAFIGYNFGLVPLIDVAAEISHIDFGTHEGADTEMSSTGLAASAVAGLNFGLVGLFGKVGVVSWSGDVQAIEASLDDDKSGTDPAYGIGAKVQLGSIALRAEYEMFSLDDADITFTSIGAVYTF